MQPDGHLVAVGADDFGYLLVGLSVQPEDDVHAVRLVQAADEAVERVQHFGLRVVVRQVGVRQAQGHVLVALPAAQVGDAGVQRDAIDPGAEAAPVFKCPVALPQVVHRLLVEVGQVFLVLRIEQAHLVDDGLVLQQQVGEFFFLDGICHFRTFCFVSRLRRADSYAVARFFSSAGPPPALAGARVGPAPCGRVDFPLSLQAGVPCRRWGSQSCT